MTYKHFLKDVERIIKNYEDYHIRVSSNSVSSHVFVHNIVQKTFVSGKDIIDILPLYGYYAKKLDKHFYIFISSNPDENMSVHRYGSNILWKE